MGLRGTTRNSSPGENSGTFRDGIGPTRHSATRLSPAPAYGRLLRLYAATLNAALTQSFERGAGSTTAPRKPYSEFLPCKKFTNN
jgi:hypothetical protein